MERRICRKDDESLYQPKIHSQRVRLLYLLKEQTGIPMTVLVDRAVSEFAENYNTESDLPEESIVDDAEEETWEDICEYIKLLNELDYFKHIDEAQNIKNSN